MGLIPERSLVDAAGWVPLLALDARAVRLIHDSVLPHTLNDDVERLALFEWFIMFYGIFTAIRSFTHTGMPHSRDMQDASITVKLPIAAASGGTESVHGKGGLPFL
jgi:hypothetical protein